MIHLVKRIAIPLNNNSQPEATMTKDILTTKLNSGITVLAKLYKGAPTAKTFANRSQAYAAAEKVGGDVVGRLPFYVRLEVA